MRPSKTDIILKIPVTVDSKGVSKLLGVTTFMWVGLLLILWLFASILFVIAASGFNKILYPLVSFIILFYITRFVLFRERYFKKKRDELKSKDFKFDFNIFWGIYEVSDMYPHIAYMNNGLKAIFVVFDKDVIVGKPEDREYTHYEAIANAYQQMTKRGIDCVHVDYMDTLGSDSRLDNLFKNVSMVENKDLKKVLTNIYDNISYNMSKMYTSYDVYCFYFGGKENVFWDELNIVLSSFMQANYVGYRILNKDGISDLVKAVVNLDSFSVNKSCESLFMESLSTEYIRPLWVEVNGQRTVINKPMEEILEAKRVADAEKAVKKRKSKKRVVQEDTEIEL